jgi:hypothetical protein
MHAEDRGANPRADDKRLRDGCVDDAFFAEFVQQTLGSLECAAEFADVLAHHEDTFVASHLLVERLVDGLKVGDFHLTARRYLRRFVSCERRVEDAKTLVFKWRCDSSRLRHLPSNYQRNATFGDAAYDSSADTFPLKLLYAMYT